MPAKIRLQRHGKKGQPFYHIVIADGRAPRDGRFIERIGSYNPLTTPATIELDFNKAIEWLQKGATPTDTAKAILSYQGVIYKNHLLKGITKGALTAEQVEEKFTTWMSEKNSKIQEKMLQLKNKKKSEAKQLLEAEIKVSEERSKAIQEKRKKEAEKAAAAQEAAVAEQEATAVDQPEVLATDAEEQAPEATAAE